MYHIFRILKDHYLKNQNRTIGKDEFPSLLSKLWTCDSIQAKANLIKSFMKSGIFPLNPHAIDHSRIIQGNSSNFLSSSNILDDDASSNLDVHHSSSIEIRSSTTTTTLDPSFSSSHQAIATLERIIEETATDEIDMNRIDENSNTFDDHPNSNTFTSSSKPTSSTRRKSNSINLGVSNGSNKNSKRKRKSVTMMGFDTSTDDEDDDDGKICD